MNKISIVSFHNRANAQGFDDPYTWQELCDRCRFPVRKPETMAKYLRAAPKERGLMKDHLGFIAARLKDDYRAAGNVLARTLVVMDMDHCPADIVERMMAVLNDAQDGKGIQSLIYSSHSHTPQAPRLRLIINPSREMTNEEYKTVCRNVAARLAADCGETDRDVPLFDHCSWGGCQMFYWPSCCQDGVYVCRKVDGAPLDVEEFLGSAQPETPEKTGKDAAAVKSAKGSAGKAAAVSPVEHAFNAAYTIAGAIDKYLRDIYRPSSGDGSRFDYIPGEGTAGLVVSKDENGVERAISFHSTDPAHGMSLTAYGLVGLHRFGLRPSDRNSAARARLEALVRGDERVKEAMMAAAGLTAGDAWQLELERNAKDGSVKSCRGNMMLILENDAGCRDMVYYDMFSQSLMLRGSNAPWSEQEGDAARLWSDDDDARLRCYMERQWGVTGVDVIRDAVVEVGWRHSRHPVRDYLSSLRWDGRKRLDTLFVDYLGADDTPLTRAVTELFFVGAVARVMTPGCKFDYCPILKGPQGIGKSTVLNVMGGEWFTDSLPNAESKDAMNLLQGHWIVEAGEFMAFKRSEREAVKRFISSEKDVYRPAYGRYTRSFPRQCVFAATTNEDKILKGDDNRRMVPVLCHGGGRFADVPQAMVALKANRDQLWAEAVTLWNDGRYPLYLNDEMETAARGAQEESTIDEDDELRTALDKFITYPQPPDWGMYTIASRQIFYTKPAPADVAGHRVPKFVSVKEVLYEAYGLRQADRRYASLANRLTKIIREMLPDWKRVGGSRHTMGFYGLIVNAWKRPDRLYCRACFA